MDAAELARLQEMYQYEKASRRKGREVVAGIDEAGRGPLAGPVVAAVVVLPFFSRNDDFIVWAGLNDSKKLTAKKRDKFFDQILAAENVSVGIGIIGEQEIDRLNILQATRQAMRKALANLEFKPDILLVDGMNIPEVKIAQRKIIDGDRRSLSIAAASVMAKVTRDRIMCQYHERYPRYGFDRHKGYGTKEHMRKLREHGPCKIHRRSFQPIALMEEIGYEI